MCFCMHLCVGICVAVYECVYNDVCVGLESCQFISSHILNEIQDIIQRQDIGLYGADGLCIRHKTPRENEKTKKKLKRFTEV